MLTNEEITQRMQMCDKATPGPWKAVDKYGKHFRIQTMHVNEPDIVALKVPVFQDVKHIAAHDPTTLKALYQGLLAARELIVLARGLGPNMSYDDQAEWLNALEAYEKVGK